MAIDWKDKRIKAMDKTIFNKKFTHEYLIDEYCAVIHSKAKNKKEYKLERKYEKNNILFNADLLPE
tara:strand:+ start:281 stop:478 length:198 start_codon:yes stop_codon:yes gene_type:complete